MKLTEESLLELLWEHNGYSWKAVYTGPEFKGVKCYMVFGAKLFINLFGVNPETGDQVFITREADGKETRDVIWKQIMLGKLHLPKEDPKPDFSKLIAST